MTSPERTAAEEAVIERAREVYRRPRTERAYTTLMGDIAIAANRAAGSAELYAAVQRRQNIARAARRALIAGDRDDFRGYELIEGATEGMLRRPIPGRLIYGEADRQEDADTETGGKIELYLLADGRVARVQKGAEDVCFIVTADKIASEMDHVYLATFANLNELGSPYNVTERSHLGPWRA